MPLHLAIEPLRVGKVRQEAAREGSKIKPLWATKKRVLELRAWKRGDIDVEMAADLPRPCPSLSLQKPGKKRSQPAAACFFLSKSTHLFQVFFSCPRQKNIGRNSAPLWQYHCFLPPIMYPENIQNSICHSIVSRGIDAAGGLIGLDSGLALQRALPELEKQRLIEEKTETAKR
ncbi:MAG: hypothetical protein LBD10_12490 [Desulfobulbus sp.]|uniref:hypothetical protein n=1 Tax=Desulfobulbus sp. TaxID=895 RepID=UPI002851A6FA|nr:hypothetical protein [Desulfobulbus sp.]MDR2551007.1 hypothetical protein [Desulfobulbus sp.]